jgi:hypothetical protein
MVYWKVPNFWASALALEPWINTRECNGEAGYALDCTALLAMVCAMEWTTPWPSRKAGSGFGNLSYMLGGMPDEVGRARILGQELENLTSKWLSQLSYSRWRLSGWWAKMDKEERRGGKPIRCTKSMPCRQGCRQGCIRPKVVKSLRNNNINNSHRSPTSCISGLLSFQITQPALETMALICLISTHDVPPAVKNRRPTNHQSYLT